MRIIALAIVLLWASPLPAQLSIVQFGQIDSLQKTVPKLLMVYVYTDWCKYCSAMKSTTLSNKTIVEQLNANFYVATLNAEEKKPLLFNGRKFVYKPNGHKTGIHELADALATVDGSVAYPTLCFLNADYEIVFQTTNYLDASAMGKLLDLLQKQWLKASK